MADTRALREEGSFLAEVVSGADTALAAETPFAGWTGNDVLTVLAFVDHMAHLVLADRSSYEHELDEFAAATAGSPEEVHRRMAAHTSGRFHVADWQPGFAALCAELDGHDPDEEVTWFGRSLTVARLVAARQMETFAYGQDVVELLGAQRPATDRLFDVADFGVRAFRFSFVNRGRAVPGERPLVELTSPSGRTWRWGDPRSGNRVAGPAEDFCLVATQRRHPADTRLHIIGPVASEWMAISQCIAGPPLPGPAPGDRLRA